MSDFTYLCPECGNCFPSETSLQDHDLAVHSSQKHICTVCRKVLKDLQLLERHIKAHQNLLHCCNICGELCENKVDFYVHVTTSHKYEGKIVCDLCFQTFPSISSLKVHYINQHAVEMTDELQKWELFCNVHSSRDFCKSDLLKDPFYPSDCPSHPKEEEYIERIQRHETRIVRFSNVSTSDKSILPSEIMDDSERAGDFRRSALNKLHIFLEKQSRNESWYTTSTDHLSSSIRPIDILERVQLSTENKNRPQEDEMIECHFCDKTFDSINDYQLAHDDKDPSNVHPHKQEKKPASFTGLKDLIEFRKSTSHFPDKKRVKGELSDKKTVIYQDNNVGVENQVEPNDPCVAEIPALMSQIHNDSLSHGSQNDQFVQMEKLCAEISALMLKVQNKNASATNQNDHLEPDGALLEYVSALASQIQIENASNEYQSDQLLAGILTMTIQNEQDEAIGMRPSMSRIRPYE